ncbi:hypothetical protein LV779_12050 [Streptomyces thinghirensis]|nr:hypothetical protein [Streptomyces thinghirensis]
MDACAALTTDLLGRAPGLRVLAVGRRPLGVAGERQVPLAPLSPEEAVELLTVRAGQRHLAYGTTPTARTATGTCANCAGAWTGSRW